MNAFPSLKFTLMWLFHLCILQLGSDENGDVRVGVFPKGEEILIGFSGIYAISQESIGASQIEVRQDIFWGMGATP